MLSSAAFWCYRHEWVAFIVLASRASGRHLDTRTLCFPCQYDSHDIVEGFYAKIQ